MLLRHAQHWKARLMSAECSHTVSSSLSFLLTTFPWGVGRWPRRPSHWGHRWHPGIFSSEDDIIQLGMSLAVKGGPVEISVKPNCGLYLTCRSVYLLWWLDWTSTNKRTRRGWSCRDICGWERVQPVQSNESFERRLTVVETGNDCTLWKLLMGSIFPQTLITHGQHANAAKRINIKAFQIFKTEQKSSVPDFGILVV